MMLWENKGAAKNLIVMQNLTDLLELILFEL